ncbi:MAG TPA: flagellar export chaperone FliS [Polyangiaceae bacterium]|nr:flagellar export chaperone FliS [Polyangiaceae bacterium]
MLDTAAARYAQVKVTTATPGELLLALYDGLFRFLNGAKLLLERGEKARASELISKSYAIVSELYIALDHEVAPELCAQLSGVYGFAMDRLTQTNIDGKVQGIVDVIRVLTPLKEAWTIAVPQAAREKAAAGPPKR